MPELPAKRKASAFTLIELLTSVSLLAILLAVLAGAFTNFTKLTTSSARRIETGQETHSVFDRLSFDLAAGLNHGGVSYKFWKDRGVIPGESTMNDAMAFLANTKSTMADSRMALVGYDVKDAGGTGDILVRHVQPFRWEDDIIAQTEFQDGAGLEQPVTSGVFRMELAFVKNDGTIVAAAPIDQNIGEYKAVLCALATLDEESLSKLDPGERRRLARVLPDAADGATPLSRWSPTLPELQSFPPFVVQNIRFHQRSYDLK